MSAEDQPAIAVCEGRFDILVAPRTGPCFWCSEETHVIDINFEANLCLNCHDAAWEEFFRAERRLASMPSSQEAHGGSDEEAIGNHLRL